MNIQQLLRRGSRAVFSREHWRLMAARRAAQRDYQAWLHAQEPDAQERARQRQQVFHHGLSFLIPTYNTDPAMLRALVDSLLMQTVDCWEACFFDGGSTRQETRRALQEAAARDARIRVELSGENAGIAGNTNRALAMARYDWIALVDHDDLLAPDAAYAMLCAAASGADMAYSDEDKCDAAGQRFFEPHLKGDFALDSLRAGNYICHLLGMEKALALRLGGLCSDYDGSQDHDLMLRASEQARCIVHIPRVLYHWRMVPSSASHQAAERCAQAAAKAVDAQLQRLALHGKAVSRLLRVEISYDLNPSDTVSLIISGAARGIQRWLNRLEACTAEPVAEVLVLGTAEPCTFQGRPCRMLPQLDDSPAGLNQAAAEAQGTLVAFLTQGVLPRTQGWLTALRMYAQRRDVGAAGTALMTRSLTYLHAGYAVDVPGGALSHQHRVNYYETPYMLTDRQVRNVTAVSRALMMIRRETLLKLGGFPAYDSDLTSAGLGLRAQAAGLVQVYTPAAAAVWTRRSAPPCLTGSAPAQDLLRWRQEFGEHPREKYYSPLLEKQRGWMLPDLSRQGEP